MEKVIVMGGFLSAVAKLNGGWIYMESLHEHNQRTYEKICHMYNEEIQRVAIVQPTGSGKSLLMAKLIEEIQAADFLFCLQAIKLMTSLNQNWMKRCWKE